MGIFEERDEIAIDSFHDIHKRLVLVHNNLADNLESLTNDMAEALKQTLGYVSTAVKDSSLILHSDNAIKSRLAMLLILLKGYDSVRRFLRHQVDMQLQVV